MFACSSSNGNIIEADIQTGPPVFPYYSLSLLFLHSHGVENVRSDKLAQVSYQYLSGQQECIDLEPGHL